MHSDPSHRRIDSHLTRCDRLAELPLDMGQADSRYGVSAIDVAGFDEASPPSATLPLERPSLGNWEWRSSTGRRSQLHLGPKAGRSVPPIRGASPDEVILALRLGLELRMTIQLLAGTFRCFVEAQAASLRARDGCVGWHAASRVLGIDFAPVLARKLLGLLDVTPGLHPNDLSPSQFVALVWNLSTLQEGALLRLCFGFIDHHRLGAATVSGLRRLLCASFGVQLLSDVAGLEEAFQKLVRSVESFEDDRDELLQVQDGIPDALVTVDEFLSHCAAHPVLTVGFLQLRANVRDAVASRGLGAKFVMCHPKAIALSRHLATQELLAIAAASAAHSAALTELRKAPSRAVKAVAQSQVDASRKALMRLRQSARDRARAEAEQERAQRPWASLPKCLPPQLHPPPGIVGGTLQADPVEAALSLVSKQIRALERDPEDPPSDESDHEDAASDPGIMSDEAVKATMKLQQERRRHSSSGDGPTERERLLAERDDPRKVQLGVLARAFLSAKAQRRRQEAIASKRSQVLVSAATAGSLGGTAYGLSTAGGVLRADQLWAMLEHDRASRVSFARATCEALATALGWEYIASGLPAPDLFKETHATLSGQSMMHLPSLIPTVSELVPGGVAIESSALHYPRDPTVPFVPRPPLRGPAAYTHMAPSEMIASQVWFSMRPPFSALARRSRKATDVLGATRAKLSVIRRWVGGRTYHVGGVHSEVADISEAPRARRARVATSKLKAALKLPLHPAKPTSGRKSVRLAVATEAPPVVTHEPSSDVPEPVTPGALPPSAWPTDPSMPRLPLDEEPQARLDVVLREATSKYPQRHPDLPLLCAWASNAVPFIVSASFQLRVVEETAAVEREPLAVAMKIGSLEAIRDWPGRHIVPWKDREGNDLGLKGTRYGDGVGVSDLDASDENPEGDTTDDDEQDDGDSDESDSDNDEEEEELPFEADEDEEAEQIARALPKLDEYALSAKAREKQSGVIAGESKESLVEEDDDGDGGVDSPRAAAWNDDEWFAQLRAEKAKRLAEEQARKDALAPLNAKLALTTGFTKEVEARPTAKSVEQEAPVALEDLLQQLRSAVAWARPHRVMSMMEAGGVIPTRAALEARLAAADAKAVELGLVPNRASWTAEQLRPPPASGDVATVEPVEPVLRSATEWSRMGGAVASNWLLSLLRFAQGKALFEELRRLPTAHPDRPSPEAMVGIRRRLWTLERSLGASKAALNTWFRSSRDSIVDSASSAAREAAIAKIAIDQGLQDEIMVRARKAKWIVDNWKELNPGAPDDARPPPLTDQQAYAQAREEVIQVQVASATEAASGTVERWDQELEALEVSVFSVGERAALLDIAKRAEKRVRMARKGR
jgi:hypothetical protein